MDQVETLCAVLGDETRVCGALSGVLRSEQQAVVGLRPEVILACLEERQALQDELGRLATRRRELVRELAARYGTPRETESASALLPLLPPAPRDRLRDGLRELRRALLEARGLERQNDRLVGAGLESVGDLLRALRALVPGARYDADARVAAPEATEQVDRRA
jgi:hypothetical protein